MHTVDSFYTSETKQVHAGKPFDPAKYDLSDERVSELKNKGLIAEGDAPKATSAPQNKVEKPLKNK